jgi:hypothetical protein
MIQADQLPFGIEIETIAPASAVAHDGLRIGCFRRGIQVPYLPPGWTAECDGSICATDGGHACRPLARHVRVDHGRLQALVAQQHLNRPQVNSALHQVRRKAMPKGVTMDGLAQPCGAPGLCHGPLERGRVDRMATQPDRPRVARQLPRGKYELPAQLLCCSRVLPLQGVGQFDPRHAAR